MNNPIESYLGSNINKFPYEVVEMDSDYESKTFFVSDQEMTFLYTTVDLVIIQTDSGGGIQSISTDFKKIISEQYYEELLLVLGQPDQIQKAGVLIDEDSEILESGVSAISKTSQLEECQFSEKPMFIRWNKLDFNIVFVLIHEQRSTHLTVSKKKDN